MGALLGAEKFIFDKLSAIADVAGGVHSGSAKEGSLYPRIVFEIDGQPKDIIVSGKIIIGTNVDYLVRVIDQSQDQSIAEGIADQIHSVLHGKDGDYDEGLVMQCLRVSPYSNVEIEDTTKETIISRGGIYHLICK